MRLGAGAQRPGLTGSHVSGYMLRTGECRLAHWALVVASHMVCSQHRGKFQVLRDVTLPRPLTTNNNDVNTMNIDY